MNDATYSVQLAAPDIAAHRDGNTGIPFVHSFDSGKPGPHVLVNAVTHGNELCGAVTVDMLLREGVRPTRGKLSFSFANVEAFLRWDARAPATTRYVDEDFNRVWSPVVLDGPRDSVELRRAREMRPLIDSVDFLLDVHSMQEECPPLMMAGPLDKGHDFARAVGYPQHIVRDTGHAGGQRMRDYDGFGDPASPKNALLIECGQHWQAASVPVSHETTIRFLRYLEVVDPGFGAAYLGSGPLPAQRTITVTDRVTVQTDRFRFTDSYRGLEVIPRAGTVLAQDGDTPVLTPYDDCVLIMPSRRLQPGQTAVRLGHYD